MPAGTSSNPNPESLEALWRESVPALYDALLAKKVGEIADADALADALDAILARPFFAKVVAPLQKRAVSSPP